MPAAGAWAIAVYFVLGNSRASAAAAGAAAALAVTIRPNLVFCVGHSRLEVRGEVVGQQVGRADARDCSTRVAYIVPAAAGVAAIAITNYVLNGSPLQVRLRLVAGVLLAPTTSGRTSATTSSGWWSSRHRWCCSGLGALFVPLKSGVAGGQGSRRIPDARRLRPGRLGFYCFYLHFDDWWYLRFLAAGVAAADGRHGRGAGGRACAACRHSAGWSSNHRRE